MIIEKRVEKSKWQGTDLGMYIRVIKKVAQKNSKIYGVLFDDCVAEGLKIYVEALQRYDVTKGSFYSYLCYRLWGIQDYCRKVTDMRFDKKEQKFVRREIRRGIGGFIPDTRVRVENFTSTQEGLLEDAKAVLSGNAYTIFKWIISRVWETAYVKKPKVNTCLKWFPHFGQAGIKKYWAEIGSYYKTLAV